MNDVPPARSSWVQGLGVPGRVVGIEVTQDDRVTMGLEDILKVWGIIRWARRGGGNIDIIYIDRDI